MEPIRNLFNKAVTEKKKPERLAGAEEFAAEVGKVGLTAAFNELKLNDMLIKVLSDGGKKTAGQREGACYIVVNIAALNASASLLMLPCVSKIQHCAGDKAKPVAAAAKAAADAINKSMSMYTVSSYVPELLKGVESFKGSADRFTKIANMCYEYPEQMATILATAIPATVPSVTSMSDEVCQAANDALTALAKTCPNPDMEQFVPSLVSAMDDQSKIPDTVYKIASTTFVAEVEGASLALMTPILSEALQVKSNTVTKRSAARIIENMCKLVDEPRYLDTFIPKIGPLLESAKKEIADPEARDVCDQADKWLKKKAAQAEPLKFNKEIAMGELKAKVPAQAADEKYAALYDILANMCALLNENSEYSKKVWISALSPVLIDLFGMKESEADTAVEGICAVAEASRVRVVEEEEEDDAEVLCDLPFGLAYGNKVLLRKTHLKLLRGHKYGLVGQNDSGKTSLLKAIADYQIEGFPTADELRTVFVATDIKTALADYSVIEYMELDPLLKAMNIPTESMVEMLNSVGFKEGAPATTTQKVGTLSGGWRMKLALSRAILLKADILLLDEPTNHLDAYNLNWLETYLLSLTNVTCVMVSHDAGLLTKVCTDMIEIDELKLHYFKGNLEKFMDARPDAKVYFELAEKGKVDFVFPKPGNLQGIKSKGKAIMKMTNITFTYPQAPKPQLNNVTIQLSLSSRVACVGENGAGKSTMIKLLTGELEPDKGSGDVWKHPNCRVGYIAQHAFHHIEKHLDKTANEYCRWRFANGGDREEQIKVTSIATPAEIKKMQEPIIFDFEQEDGSVKKLKFVVERFTERRRENKSKKNTEYEVSLVNGMDNYWADQELLEKSGFKKMLMRVDEKIAQRAAAFQRPLTKENVQKMYLDLGLAAEFSTHMPIGSLSGGQKVKVVLGSALWNCPHILILDEPTNYLDRESLGALARAIRIFDGGVVMITHNSQFCDNLCPIVWHLQNNTLDIKGDSEWMAEAGKQQVEVIAAPDEMQDKFGNTVKIAKKKKYTKKEIKMKKLRREKRKRNGEGDYDSDEDI